MLVRRVQQGSVWHPYQFVLKILSLIDNHENLIFHHFVACSDALLGTIEYGNYTNDTDSATFSMLFSTFASNNTEILFANGDNSSVIACTI